VVNHLIITIKQYLSFEAQGFMAKLRQRLRWIPPYEIELRIRNQELRILEQAARVAEEAGKMEGRKRE